MQPPTATQIEQDQRQRIQNSRLYALFWRWHFITGFFAVPILVIAALTGAVITYQDEWHPLLYPQTDLVMPGSKRVSLAEQVQLAKDAYPNIHIHGLIVYPQGSKRSNIVRFGFMDTDTNFWNPWNMGQIYVDPYSGKVLGMMDESQDAFDLITNLHKSFFLKLPGQLAVDFATSWGVISFWQGCTYGGRAGRKRFGGFGCQDFETAIGFFCVTCTQFHLFLSHPLLWR